MSDFFRRQAAEAGENLRREFWAVLVAFPFDLEVWICGCAEARVLIEPDGRAVFLVEELRRVLDKARTLSELRVICAAKRALNASVERVEEDEDDNGAPLFSGEGMRAADPGPTPAIPPITPQNVTPEPAPVVPGLSDLIGSLRNTD